MLNYFKQIFEGLDYAYGNFIREVSNLPTQKTKGKAFVIKKPLTDELWQKHLDGIDPSLGIFPVTAANVCKWGCIDIDKYTYDYEALLQKIREKSLPLIMCRSKSGGAHLFLFSEIFVPASEMQYALEKCAALLGIKDILDCIYPKQTKILASRGDVGNFLNLPYFNVEEGSRYAFKDNFEAATIAEFFKLYDKYVVKNFKAFLKIETPLSLKIKPPTGNGKNPYKEAPPCLLALIEEKIRKGERDSALINFGIFYKKSHKEFLDKKGQPHTWENLLREANRRYFTPPLSDPEVSKTIKSLEKDYKYTCHQQPIQRVCDSKLCITRKYGIGPGERIVQATEVIGDITEYTSRPPRFFIDAKSSDPEKDKERIEVDGPTLRNKEAFYDAALEQASIWLPDMKSGQYKEIMKEKFDRRLKEVAPEEANEDYEFKETFGEFLELINAYTKKENLLEGVNYFNIKNKSLEFNLNQFSKFLKSRKIKISRGALCTKIKRVLKAEKKTGKVSKGKEEISCVTWEIKNFNIKESQLTVEGEVIENKKVNP